MLAMEPSIKAKVDQLVASLEIHWSLPCGKIPSMATWTGDARVRTNQEPSLHWFFKRNRTPR